MTPLAITTLERVPFESIVPAADTITIDTPTFWNAALADAKAKAR